MSAGGKLLGAFLGVMVLVSALGIVFAASRLGDQATYDGLPTLSCRDPHVPDVGTQVRVVECYTAEDGAGWARVDGAMLAPLHASPTLEDSPALYLRVYESDPELGALVSEGEFSGRVNDLALRPGGEGDPVRSVDTARAPRGGARSVPIILSAAAFWILAFVVWLVVTLRRRRASSRG